MLYRTTGKGKFIRKRIAADCLKLTFRNIQATFSKDIKINIILFSTIDFYNSVI